MAHRGNERLTEEWVNVSWGIGFWSSVRFVPISGNGLGINRRKCFGEHEKAFSLRRRVETVVDTGQVVDQPKFLMEKGSFMMPNG